MDIVKDLTGLAAVLFINVASWAAGITALLGVLPIPHSPHDWGLTIGSAVLFLVARVRDRKRVKRRLGALRVSAADNPPLSPPVVVLPRAARRVVVPAADKHSAKVRKMARP